MRAHTNISDKVELINFVGFILIGLICLGYSFFGANFAEYCIQVSFLPFPVFIGEIVLGISMTLLLARWLLEKKRFGRRHYLLFVYCGFIIIKALWGYRCWGTLALRHAALFYYFLFALCTYEFFQKNFFTNPRLIFAVFLLIGILKFVSFNVYFVLPFFIIALVSVFNCPKKVIKYTLLTLLFLAIPYKEFFNSPRTIIVASAICFVYIIFVLIRLSRFKKIFIPFSFSVICLFAIFVSILQINTPEAIDSILNFKKLSLDYKSYAAVINEKKGSFKRLALLTQAYNPNRKVVISTQNQSEQTLFNKEEVRGDVAIQQDSTVAINSEQNQSEQTLFNKEETRGDVAIQQDSTVAINSEQNQSEQTLFNKEEVRGDVAIQQDSVVAINSEQNQSEQTLFNKEEARGDVAIQQDSAVVINSEQNQNQSEQTLFNKEEVRGKKEVVPKETKAYYANTLFRIFIWRDLAADFKREMPLFGFDFGKPFRSDSLEIMGWVQGEWMRDGWISIHNSFLDILYRAGVAGLLFIAAFIIMLINMIRQFLKTYSLKGALLSGILVYWFVAANFGEILELPYTAIPIWSLFGAILACSDNKKNIRKE